MYWIVLETELATRHNFKELGVLLKKIVLRYSFCPPKSWKPTKQAILCT